MSFQFLDPGPLIDRELELVTPDQKWINPMLISAAHPLSHGDERSDHTTRGALMEFLELAPRGRFRGDPAQKRVPGYTFWMRLLPQYHPPVPMAGSISLRVVSTRDVEMYFGHIGYNVFPPARANHYAERSCRLLLPLARAHGLSELWITCNPDNIASRRTCERLGGTYIETVPVPANNVLHQRGDLEKCRYLVTL